VLIVGILAYLYVKRTIRLPFAQQLEADHELQVFAAILFCFGGALLASIFGLSAALGAFVGGMIMREAILGGAYLAQIGELSFLVAATAFQLHILEDFGYQFTISLISLTLLIGVFWVGLTEMMLARRHGS